MTATLEERLNYLVSYSSQLIFVSGDSLAEQTNALEDTLFLQNENTELAYFVADDSFQITDYRRQLCQQLLGDTQNAFTRPLNECLASLNEHNGPVMIAITRAEKMSNDVLQELWELVLQSRFAGNKQHLNVVLFGETSWAAQAKQWLPANNSDTPLLLRTQKTSLQSAHSLEQYAQVAPLEKVALDQKIEQRPLVTMGAFWAATTIVCLCVLVAVAINFVGVKNTTLFAPLGTELELPSQPEQTVTQWNSEQKSAPGSNQAVTPEQMISLLREPDPSTPIDSADASAVATAITAGLETQTPTTEVQVTQTALQAPTETTPVIEEQSTQVAIEAAAASELPETASPFSGDTYFIQIAGLKDGQLLERFLQDQALKNNTLIYETERYGGPWYVVVMKTAYNSLAEARAAINDLPEFQNSNLAFVKSAAAIRKELSTHAAKDTLASVQ